MMVRAFISMDVCFLLRSLMQQARALLRMGRVGSLSSPH